MITETLRVNPGIKDQRVYVGKEGIEEVLAQPIPKRRSWEWYLHNTMGVEGRW
jgi:hypothetical protein